MDDEYWSNGRLVRRGATGICVHGVGTTPGMWCGGCNTDPDHPSPLAVTDGDS